MKKKKATAAKITAAKILQRFNERDRDSAFARYIEHDIDSLYHELDANDETRRAIERARDVTRAKCAAEYIREALEGVSVAVEGDEICRAINLGAKEAWFMAGMYISSSQSPAEVLRLVAKVLEGKPISAAKGDDAIIEAYGKAIRTGERKHERTVWFMPFLSEVYNAFDKGRDVPWRRPTKDVLRHRLKILRLPLSEDRPGRHRNGARRA
jgi:hypothetical protein